MDIIVRSIKAKDCALFSKFEYLVVEHSFRNQEENDVSLMINHQYLSLDVSLKSNVITGVSGYFNLDNCSEKSLVPLEGESGRVEVTACSFLLESGIGYSYPIAGESFFDNERKIVQIGELQHNAKNINISENITLGLFEENIIYIQIKIN